MVLLPRDPVTVSWGTVAAQIRILSEHESFPAQGGKQTQNKTYCSPMPLHAFCKFTQTFAKTQNLQDPSPLPSHGLVRCLCCVLPSHCYSCRGRSYVCMFVVGRELLPIRWWFPCPCQDDSGIKGTSQTRPRLVGVPFSSSGTQDNVSAWSAYRVCWSMRVCCGMGTRMCCVEAGANGNERGAHPVPQTMCRTN